jgi:hypothetical protein
MKCNVRIYFGLNPLFQINILRWIIYLEKWQLDEDKLTFIILAAALDEDFPVNSVGLSPADKRLADLQMVGDVNIFLNGGIPSPQVHSPQSVRSPSLP